jgi:hypothetical protein
VLSLNELDRHGFCIRQDWYSTDQVEEALDRFDLVVARQAELEG